MPKVSVCVPVYNVEQYIERCIESILNQSLKDIEIIVVNDCTPDKSMDIVKSYAKKDKRIKIIEHDVNHGLMMARRTGYMAASGDYITFCDSDDTLPSNALESLYSAAVLDNADVVSGTIQYIPNDGNRFLWANKMDYGYDKIAVYKALLKNECGHNLCSRLFRRNLLQKHSYQTFEGATNGEDGMLFYQVVDNAFKIIAIDSIVYEYYQNMSSSSNVRLNERALWSILLANSLCIKCAGKYRELQNLVTWKVSRSLFNLKFQGYNIDKYVSELRLNFYAKTLTFIRSHGLCVYIAKKMKKNLQLIKKYFKTKSAVL